jgi:formylmethanofuran dehydrogenase subunit E
MITAVSKARRLVMLVVGLCLFFGFQSVSKAACPGKTTPYPETVKDLPPITIVRDGETRNISLCDAFDAHGHACAGATMAFMAVRYGFELLYGTETPAADDLIIVTRAPGGPMDLLDLIMKGEDRANRTWPPAGITRDAENFVFQFYRKSTLKGVTLRLEDDLWPQDWFELRDKFKAGTITDAEQKKRQKDRQHILQEFPKMSFSELFGEPEVFTFIAWGKIEPGEMDKCIRQQRKAMKIAQ